MKKYNKPVFIVESYAFNHSFASDCQYNVDPNKSITIVDGETILCDIQDNGHKANFKKGVINKLSEKYKSVTLFNDGIETECQFDWSGRGSKVIAPDRTELDTFLATFVGANSDNDKHTPAFKGDILFS